MNSMAITREVEKASTVNGMCAVGSPANWPWHRCMVRRSIVKSSSRFRLRSNSRASDRGL